MAKLDELVLDLYGPLTYKSSFARGTGLLSVTWVPDEDLRRLRAYAVLRSYLSNMSRYMLGDDKAQSRRREYGDPAATVEALVSALLGEETTIVVRGAGETTGEDETPVNPEADAWQEWFDQWADDERPMLTVTEVETDAVGLGDGLYEVIHDGEKMRPRLVPHDPGFYFPVIDPETSKDYPDRLHVAWEFERTELENDVYRTHKYVRRITWELVPIESLADQVGPDGQPLYETRRKPLPWADKPPVYTCLKTDATWRWDSLGARRVDDFTPERVHHYAMTPYIPGGPGEPGEMPRVINRMDLGIDYIPVVHQPNTPNRKEQFGTSAIALALQVFDDIQSVDTDLAMAAGTTGTPPLSAPKGVKSADGTSVNTYGPGTVFEGEVSVVDTSRSLDALLKQIEQLLKRAASTTQVPESVMGRVDPGQVEAGVILALSFGPLSRVVQKMRRVREEKHPLLLKFVARYAQLYTPDDVPKGEIPKIEFRYGRFMPQDRQGVVTEIATLRTAGVISRLSAIRRLIEEAGYDIDDAQDELERIEHEDFAGANLLADAIGVEAAGEYLDRADLVEEPPPPPDPALPPADPDQPPTPAEPPQAGDAP